MSESSARTIPTRHDSEECRSAQLLAVEVMRRISTPLEILSNLVFLTTEEAHDPDSVKKYMQIAEEQITMLSRISNHTLDLVGFLASAEPVDLVQLIDSAIGRHQRVAAAKKIHLVRRVSPALTARLNGPNILFAISSLIVNALDALPDAGTLSVRFRKRADGIHILVADNGHGIAPEDADRVYDPFFSTRKGSGKGLGLSFARKIVEDHNGRIRFRSSVRAGRSGTAFKLFLPIEDLA